jgi:hypothetical protein
MPTQQFQVTFPEFKMLNIFPFACLRTLSLVSTCLEIHKNYNLIPKRERESCKGSRTRTVFVLKGSDDGVLYLTGPVTEVSSF